MYDAKSEPCYKLWTLGDGHGSAQVTDCNKCTPLVEVLIVGEAVRVKGARGIREISVLCSVLL